MRAARFVTAAVALLLGALPAAGAEVRSFRIQSRSAFLAGRLDGIGVDDRGTLQLADRAVRLADITEPFLFTGASHPRGWVLGTGNSGRVLLLDAEGGLEVLHTAAEPEIFAVLADADGTVFAGSSPRGKVYRIAGGRAEVFFDPQETYIWALARSAAGDLLVATGTEGRLYRVDREGRGEVLYDGEDTHLRSLQPLPGGDLLVGTAGEGLIVRLDPDGVARTLYDAAQPEVVALTAAADGRAYAAVLASEASLVDLAAPAAAPTTAATGGGAEGEADQEAVRITVTPAEAGGTGSRPEGFKGPRAELLSISPEGVVERLAGFEEETVYALLWHRDRLWVGTGLEGKLYSLRGRKPVLEKDVDERQVVALLADRPGPAFATTNAAGFYRIAGETERRGTYTSPALDAGQVARFGTLAWQGEQPAGTRVRFSFRSGLSAQPDQTWTAWSKPAEGQDGGREVPVAGVPAGRYLQWRAELVAADGRSPTLTAVTVSYLQANQPPRITSLKVLDPGQILVPASFNPATQVYEPAHPNRQGIFTDLRPATTEDRRLKTLWKLGYRTLQWEAEDPNGDDLRYDLAFQPEPGGGKWLAVAEDLEETYHSFDAAALPDGDYRFRLVVRDRRGDDPELMVAEELSVPVLIDHTPPALGAVERGPGEWRIEVEDALSPLREAVYSVDAGEWLPATAADGLLDGQRETLTLVPPPAAALVLLRVTDAAFNLRTFDLSGAAR